MVCGVVCGVADENAGLQRERRTRRRRQGPPRPCWCCPRLPTVNGPARPRELATRPPPPPIASQTTIAAGAVFVLYAVAVDLFNPCWCGRRSEEAPPVPCDAARVEEAEDTQNKPACPASHSAGRVVSHPRLSSSFSFPASGRAGAMGAAPPAKPTRRGRPAAEAGGATAAPQASRAPRARSGHLARRDARCRGQADRPARQGDASAAMRPT